MDIIFSTPSESVQGIFRICGKCPRCKNKEKSQRMIDNFKNTRIIVKEPQKLFSDEYILICSSERRLPIHNQMACGGDNNIPTHYISNYGRCFCIHDHGRGCHGQIEEITDNWGKKIKLSPLTQEFINIYNSVNFMGGQYSHIFRKQDSLNMILEYNKNSDQPGIVSTEVVPQSTDPSSGYYASLTSYFRKQDPLNMILEYHKNSEKFVIIGTELVWSAAVWAALALAEGLLQDIVLH